MGLRRYALSFALLASMAAAAPAQSARAPVIVAFGDSLTAGQGAPEGASYPDFLQRRLSALHWPGRVVNEGVSGDTTTDGLERLPEILAEKPTLVILEFGGNDGLRGLPVATTRANLQSMIARFQRAHIAILLAGMSLPPNYGPQYIDSFRKIYRDLARQDGLPLIPFLYGDLAARLPSQPGLLQADGLHATAAGNAVVAETVLRYLRPLLHLT